MESMYLVVALVLIAVGFLLLAAELVLPHAEYNVNYELEALFTPRGSGTGYVLLDKDQPYSFE